MKRISLLFLIVICGVAFYACENTEVQQLNIVPRPVEVQVTKGHFLLTPQTVIQVEKGEENIVPACRFFADYVGRSFGSPLKIEEGGMARNAIHVAIDTTLGQEAYQLTVNKKKIDILAGSGVAVFYAFQTLRQMTPVAMEKGEKMTVAEIQNAVIKDEPRFAYRGAMLDVGRHLFTVKDIKTFIDMLALHKLNWFHWHLTDDQGWRIEIKKYPKLMEVGAYRAQTCVSNYDEEMTGGDGIPYGGYYTQEEVKDIVAYAQARHVAIIPEIELPGHSLAALASYPHLACGDQPGPFRVAEWWGIYEDVYCAGKEETFRFLEDVLTEVMELFPGKYIHIGGDECPKERWKKCAYCQKRIKEEGLKDEFELQSYFVKRIEKFVNEKGREIIGWDEILEGGLAPRATVMNWRDTSEGIKAARQHHDVIMAPNAFLYFDYIQGDRAQEPLAIGWGYNPTERVYVYEPVPEQLAPEHRPYIIGVEAPLWTEHIDTYRKAEYMLFPRLMALSEIAWSVPEVKDLKNFKEERLPVHLAWLDTTGIIYRVPEPIGMERDTLYGAEFTVSLKVPVEGGKIYYNFEGQPARETDYLYEKPFRIIVPEGQKRELKAITVAPSGKRSTTATTIFIHQKSK